VGTNPLVRQGAQAQVPTNNARSEELAEKASYKDPWKRGQRCIIPAMSFDEPYWGPFEHPFSRCEWWRFWRADGAPWGLAGSGTSGSTRPPATSSRATRC
jgi:putative SOS response-associated peptidase YedK